MTSKLESLWLQKFLMSQSTDVQEVCKRTNFEWSVVCDEISYATKDDMLSRRKLKETLYFLFFLFVKFPLLYVFIRVPEYCQSAKDVFYRPILYAWIVYRDTYSGPCTITWPSWRLDWNIIRSTSNTGVSYGTILTLSLLAKKEERRVANWCNNA